MRIPFNPKNVICDFNDLYGQKTLFEQLIAVANRKSNTQLIGMRRFGKTSVFRCLEEFLKIDHGSKVYPIYFDYKEVGTDVKGTANVYRYALAVFISILTKEKIFTEPEDFRGQTIVPSEIWEDVYLKLKDVNDIRVPGLFEDVITFFSDLLEKTILFLFDEYEYLFRFSFDDPSGFMKLRNFASKLSDNGNNSFTFFVAGGYSWEHLCSITGSPELNCIDQTLYIKPIGIDAFKNMWDDETQLIEDCPEDLKNGFDYAYRLSGGIPFYGKVIGSNWFTTGVKPDLNVIYPHVKELYNSLESEQQHLLTEIINGNKRLPKSHHLNELIDKGLVNSISKNQYVICAGFLESYISTNSSPMQTESKIKCVEITERIEDLIFNINNTHHNKRGKFIFAPMNQDLSLYRDLKTECLFSDQFTNFAIAIYHIVFERTKENIDGKDLTKSTLPTKFKRKNEFVDIVDMLRHSLGRGHLMETFTPRKGQMTKAQMLMKLTGTKNEPNKPEEFSNLQIIVLKRFEQELMKLKGIVEEMK